MKFVLLYTLPSVMFLVNCSSMIPTPPQTLETQTVTPSWSDPVVTHPELEVITQENIERLEEIEHWGKGNVYDIAFSPDEKTIAFSTPRGIYFYDTLTAEEKTFIDYDTPTEETKYIKDDRPVEIDFSPDGKYIAISYSNQVLIFEISVGKRVSSIYQTTDDFALGEIREIKFSPDGKAMLIESYSKVTFIPCEHMAAIVNVYNIETRQKIFERKHCPTGTIFPKFISKSEKVFLTFWNFDENAIGIVDTETGALQENIFVFSDQYPSYDFSLDGKLLAIKTDEEQTKIVDINTKQVIRVLNGHLSFFDDSSKYVVSKMESWEFWDNEKLVCKIPKNIYSTGIFSPNGKYLIVDQIYLWDISVCKNVTSFPLYRSSGIILPNSYSTFNLNGQMLLAPPRLWDVSTGEFKFLFETKQVEHGNYSLLYDIEIIAKNNDLVALYYDIRDNVSLLGFWDVATGKEIKIIEMSGRYDGLSISHDETTMAIGFKNGIRLFDIGSKTTIKTIPLATNPLFRRVKISPDGSRLAVINSYDGASDIYFINFDTEEIYQKIDSDIQNVSVAISPDWKSIALVSKDGHINIVEVETSRTITSLLGHSLISKDFHNPPMLVYHPDGVLLVSKGSLTTMRFWDSKSGVLLGELDTDFDSVNFSISPDGRLLAFLCDDGTIRIWGIKKH